MPTRAVQRLRNAFQPRLLTSSYLLRWSLLRSICFIRALLELDGFAAGLATSTATSWDIRRRVTLYLLAVPVLLHAAAALVPLLSVSTFERNNLRINKSIVFISTATRVLADWLCKQARRQSHLADVVLYLVHQDTLDDYMQQLFVITALHSLALILVSGAPEPRAARSNTQTHTPHISIPIWPSASAVPVHHLASVVAGAAGDVGGDAAGPDEAILGSLVVLVAAGALRRAYGKYVGNKEHDRVAQHSTARPRGGGSGAKTPGSCLSRLAESRIPESGCMSPLRRGPWPSSSPHSPVGTHATATAAAASAQQLQGTWGGESVEDHQSLGSPYTYLSQRHQQMLGAKVLSVAYGWRLAAVAVLHAQAFGATAAAVAAALRSAAPPADGAAVTAGGAIAHTWVAVAVQGLSVLALGVGAVMALRQTPSFPGMRPWGPVFTVAGTVLAVLARAMLLLLRPRIACTTEPTKAALGGLAAPVDCSEAAFGGGLMSSSLPSVVAVIVLTFLTGEDGRFTFAAESCASAVALCAAALYGGTMDAAFRPTAVAGGVGASAMAALRHVLAAIVASPPAAVLLPPLLVLAYPSLVMGKWVAVASAYFSAAAPPAPPTAVDADEQPSSMPQLRGTLFGGDQWARQRTTSRTKISINGNEWMSGWGGSVSQREVRISSNSCPGGNDVDQASQSDASSMCVRTRSRAGGNEGPARDPTSGSGQLPCLPSTAASAAGGCAGLDGGTAGLDDGTAGAGSMLQLTQRGNDGRNRRSSTGSGVGGGGAGEVAKLGSGRHRTSAATLPTAPRVRTASGTAGLPEVVATAGTHVERPRGLLPPAPQPEGNWTPSTCRFPAPSPQPPPSAPPQQPPSLLPSLPEEMSACEAPLASQATYNAEAEGVAAAAARTTATAAARRGGLPPGANLSSSSLGAAAASAPGAAASGNAARLLLDMHDLAHEGDGQDCAGRQDGGAAALISHRAGPRPAFAVHGPPGDAAADTGAAATAAAPAAGAAAPAAEDSRVPLCAIASVQPTSDDFESGGAKAPLLTRSSSLEAAAENAKAGEAGRKGKGGGRNRRQSVNNALSRCSSRSLAAALADLLPAECTGGDGDGGGDGVSGSGGDGGKVMGTAAAGPAAHISSLVRRRSRSWGVARALSASLLQSRGTQVVSELAAGAVAAAAAAVGVATRPSTDGAPAGSPLPPPGSPTAKGRQGGRGWGVQRATSARTLVGKSSLCQSSVVSAAAAAAAEAVGGGGALEQAAVDAAGGVRSPRMGGADAGAALLPTSYLSRPAHRVSGCQTASGGGASDGTLAAEPYVSSPLSGPSMAAPNAAAAGITGTAIRSKPKRATTQSLMSLDASKLTPTAVRSQNSFNAQSSRGSVAASATTASGGGGGTASALYTAAVELLSTPFLAASACVSGGNAIAATAGLSSSGGNAAALAPPSPSFSARDSALASAVTSGATTVATTDGPDGDDVASATTVVYTAGTSQRLPVASWGSPRANSSDICTRTSAHQAPVMPTAGAGAIAGTIGPSTLSRTASSIGASASAVMAAAASAALSLGFAASLPPLQPPPSLLSSAAASELPGKDGNIVSVAQSDGFLDLDFKDELPLHEGNGDRPHPEVDPSRSGGGGDGGAADGGADGCPPAEALCLAGSSTDILGPEAAARPSAAVPPVKAASSMLGPKPRSEGSLSAAMPMAGMSQEEMVAAVAAAEAAAAVAVVAAAAGADVPADAVVGPEGDQPLGKHQFLIALEIPASLTTAMDALHKITAAAGITVASAAAGARTPRTAAAAAGDAANSGSDDSGPSRALLLLPAAFAVLYGAACLVHVAALFSTRWAETALRNRKALYCIRHLVLSPALQAAMAVAGLQLQVTPLRTLVRLAIAWPLVGLTGGLMLKLFPLMASGFYAVHELRSWRQTTPYGRLYDLLRFYVDPLLGYLVVAGVLAAVEWGITWLRATPRGWRLAVWARFLPAPRMLGQAVLAVAMALQFMPQLISQQGHLLSWLSRQLEAAGLEGLLQGWTHGSGPPGSQRGGDPGVLMLVGLFVAVSLMQALLMRLPFMHSPRSAWYTKQHVKVLSFMDAVVQSDQSLPAILATFRAATADAFAGCSVNLALLEDHLPPGESRAGCEGGGAWLGPNGQDQPGHGHGHGHGTLEGFASGAQLDPFAAETTVALCPVHVAAAVDAAAGGGLAGSGGSAASVDGSMAAGRAGSATGGASRDCGRGAKQQVRWLPLSALESISYATSQRLIVFTNDYATSSLLFQDWTVLHRAGGGRSMMVAPLVFNGRDLGALEVVSPWPNVFDEQMRRIVVEFATQLGQALYNKVVEDEASVGDRLLQEIMPSVVAEQVKRQVLQRGLSQINAPGEDIVYKHWHPQVSVLFADVLGYTRLSCEVDPEVVMQLLHVLFSKLDSLCDQYGCYKVNTIGDCYIACTGLLVECADHAQQLVDFGKALLQVCAEVDNPLGGKIQMRVGINSGRVMSGIVGRTRPHFTLYGDCVNTASRMESTGVPGTIQITEDTYSQLSPPEQSMWRERSSVEVKGKGPMRTYVYLNHAGAAAMGLLGPDSEDEEEPEPPVCVQVPSLVGPASPDPDPHPHPDTETELDPGPPPTQTRDTPDWII